MRRIPIPISPAIAIAIGLIVLLGYFLTQGTFAVLRDVLLRWGLILAAVALLVGAANLFTVHAAKVTSRHPAAFYSIILLLSFISTLLIVLVFGPTHPVSMVIYNSVQVPVEVSLMGVLAVVLVYSGARVLGRRMNILTVIFVATVLVLLFAMTPLPGMDLPVFSGLRSFIVRVPAAAGARGLLLGVILGTIATGLRVLIGADRPYGG